MSSGAASPRVLVLAAVVAAHAGALLVLLAETRTRLVRGESAASPLLVMLFEAHEPQALAASAGRAPSLPASRYRPAAAAGTDAPAPAMPAAAGGAIDWAAEATAAAARQIEADEQRIRQPLAPAPKASPMFATRPKRPEFRWSHASTHRVEPVPGLGTIIHLSDECAIFLFVIIPIAGGCALEKTPARGDLFEHMHDPDPGPEP